MPRRVVPVRGTYSFRLLWDCDNRENTVPQRHTRESRYTLRVDREEIVNTCREFSGSVHFEHSNSQRASARLDVVDVGVSSDTKYGFAASMLTKDTITRSEKSSYTEEHRVSWEFTVGPQAHLKFYQVHYSLPGISCLTDAYIQLNGDRDPEPSDFEVEFQVVEEDILIPPGKYHIRSHHGTYLAGTPGGEGSRVELTSDKRDHWTVIPVPGTSNVGLLSSQGTLLRAHPGGEGAHVDLQINRSNWQVQPWEQWRAVSAEDGRFALMSAHGLYLRANHSVADQQINRSNWAVQPWEQFEFIAAE